MFVLECGWSKKKVYWGRSQRHALHSVDQNEWVLIGDIPASYGVPLLHDISIHQNPLQDPQLDA